MADKQSESEESSRDFSRRSILSVIGIGAVSATSFAGYSSWSLKSPTQDIEPTEKAQSSAEAQTEVTNEEETADTNGKSIDLDVGVYDGTGKNAARDVTRIESWADSQIDVQNVFVPWDNGQYEFETLFGTVIPEIWSTNRELMLTWEPFLTKGETTPSILEETINGDYDDYFTAWISELNNAASRSQKEAQTVYIRLAHEMNGNWYPWAPSTGSSTPTEYKQMWEYVRQKVESESSSKLDLQWIWCPNGQDVGEYRFEEMYPGDESVDWVGVDCYNFGAEQDWSEWKSPHELFVNPIKRLDNLSSAPISVPEFATTSLTSSGHDVERKGEWIRESFKVLDELGVEMAIWFNEDKETDWAVFGGERGTTTVTLSDEDYNAYSEFADVVCQA